MENCFSVHMDEKELNQMSPLALAHCGDAVFELLARSFLCVHGGVRADDLHRKTVALVSAGAQAARAERMTPMLTEWEMGWYKRGRNVHTHAVPKSATPSQYARATGLECLFGALYLTGQTDRANELFLRTMEEDHGI